MALQGATPPLGHQLHTASRIRHGAGYMCTGDRRHRYTCAYVPTVAVGCRGGAPHEVKKVIEKGELDIEGHAEGGTIS